MRDYEFGQFRLTPELYELTRAGRPVRLEKIPFDLLVLLVERHDELVSRELITTTLWGNGGLQDLDQSLNTAIRKVRLALRDSADEPRFVQTVVGRGYRFLPMCGSMNVLFCQNLARRRHRRRSPPRRVASRPSGPLHYWPVCWRC